MVRESAKRKAQTLGRVWIDNSKNYQTTQSVMRIDMRHHPGNARGVPRVPYGAMGHRHRRRDTLAGPLMMPRLDTRGAAPLMRRLPEMRQ